MKPVLLISLLMVRISCFNGLAQSSCCDVSPNLLSGYNPDFSAPFVSTPPGFTTDNTYSPTPVGSGNYYIVASRNWGSCFSTPQFDHTSGNATGRFLWYDTPSSATLWNPGLVWEPHDPLKPPSTKHLIAVQANTLYTFSAWFRDLGRGSGCDPSDAPIAGMRINGVNMGEIDLGKFVNPCCPEWKHLCVSWYSESNTTAHLQLESRKGQGWTDLGVDDIYFGESFGNAKLILANDTVACEGEELELVASNGSATGLLWSTGATTPSIKVTEAGTYWLQVQGSQCMRIDSVRITFNPAPHLDLGDDTIICQGEQLLLTTNNLNANVLWQDGSQSANFLVTASGLYWSLIEQNECQATDSIVVTMLDTLPETGLLEDTMICPDRPVSLSVNSGFDSIQWSTGATSPDIIVEQAGSFWVYVRHQCGENLDSCQVTLFEEDPPELTLPGDTFLCQGETFRVSLSEADFDFAWSTGSTVASPAIYHEGNISVIVSDYCNDYEYSSHVDFRGCYCDIYLPNSFTPNDDPFNGEFEAKTICQYDQFEILIYDRWGIKIFESNDVRFSWDGKYRGVDCPQDTYVYKITYELKKGSRTVQEQLMGQIHLLR